jgi:anti-anti-sigma factor
MHANFSVSYDPPVGIMKISGELDLMSRGRLAWRLVDLEALDCRTLRLDVGQVTFIDAACLRLIDEARHRVTSRGGRLELTSASLCFALVSRLAGYRDLAAQADLLTRGGSQPTDLVGSTGRRSGSHHGGRGAHGQPVR